MAGIQNRPATAAKQDTLNTRIGEVQASPTANTVLDRLKALKTSIDAISTLVGEVQASPTANSLLARLKTIADGTGSITAVPEKASSATVAQVASSATNVTIAAAAAGRKGLIVFNASTQILYLKFGATASATDYTVQVAAGASFTMPSAVYTGIVDGLWASANGYAYVTTY